MDRRAAWGFTLIEMMVVLVIIAITLTGVGYSIGATATSKLRASCMKIAAAVQYAYSHAVTSGMTTRLVLDFESRSFHLEETAGPVVLSRDDESGEGLVRQEEVEEAKGAKGLLDRQMNGIGGGAAGKTGGGLGSAAGIPGLGAGLGSGTIGSGDMNSLMQNLTEGPLTDPFLLLMSQGSMGTGPTGYRRPSFSAASGKLGAVRELEGDTAFAVVFTPHDPIPRKEGKAYLYFFPGGVTEHAIIQLSDGGELIHSVEVHPLNGRATVWGDPVEPEGNLDELQEANP